MVYGFNDSKEKVEFQDAIIVHEIETTIASISAHASIAKQVPLSSYQITGYQFIGIVGQIGEAGVILHGWFITKEYKSLGLGFCNVSNSDKTDVTMKVKGLYIRVS